jgi:hypothetical protein
MAGTLYGLCPLYAVLASLDLKATVMHNLVGTLYGLCPLYAVHTSLNLKTTVHHILVGSLFVPRVRSTLLVPLPDWLSVGCWHVWLVQPSEAL